LSVSEREPLKGEFVLDISVYLCLNSYGNRKLEYIFIMKNKFDYSKICSGILSLLPHKSQEVIKKRFGLEPFQKSQTLQQIGDSFGISRERVRQIESRVIYKLCRDCSSISDSGPQTVFSFFKNYLKAQAGFKREDLLLRDLADEKEQRFVFFLLNLAPNLRYFAQSDNFYSFWATNDIREKALAFLDILLKKLKEKNTPLSRPAIYALSAGENKIFIDGLIEVSRIIDEGPLGDIGLAFWPEVKPRGVRDAVYLILKKKGQPLHFSEIAKNSHGLSGHFFQKRKLLAQTIHNELIRDPQFILVGRGIYGLKEWGYSDGTVKDVICDILKKNKTALSRQEILEEALRQRMVQPNTVFLNLNNKTYFKKDNEGKYTLKEI